MVRACFHVPEAQLGVVAAGRHNAIGGNRHLM